MADLIAPQTPPIKNTNPASWDLVVQDFKGLYSADEPGPAAAIVADMQDRDNFGFEKYGVRIQPENGRDNLVDAYQEMLDGAVYFRSAIFEMELVADEAVPELYNMYNNTLTLIMQLRSAIWMRDGQ